MSIRNIIENEKVYKMKKIRVLMGLCIRWIVRRRFHTRALEFFHASWKCSAFPTLHLPSEAEATPKGNSHTSYGNFLSSRVFNHPVFTLSVRQPLLVRQSL